jgi:hypothetical protein
MLDSIPPVELHQRVIGNEESPTEEALSEVLFVGPRPASSVTLNGPSIHEPSYKAQGRRQKLSRRHVLGEWVWELSTWGLGTVAMLSILLLLVLFNGRPVRDWHSRITINTMISALSQAVVTTLLVSVSSCLGQTKWIWYQKENGLDDIDALDVASRGAYGSLLVLLKPRKTLLVLSLCINWHLIINLRHLAVLGSLITVLMLGFQPFVQQAVGANGEHFQQLGLSATISRATRYNTSSSDDIVYDSYTNPPYFKVSAMVKGFISPSLPSHVLGSCPSSKCTFEPYNSLAFCSTTKDISSTIIISDCKEKPRCNFTTEELEGEFNFLPGVTNIAVFANKTMADRPYPDTLANRTTFSLHGTPFDLSMVDIFVFYSWMGIVSPPEVPPLKISVFKASIGLCLATMETSIENGTTSTTVRDVYRNLNWTGGLYENENGYVVSLTPFWTQLDGSGTNYTVDYPSLDAAAFYLTNKVLRGNASVGEGSIGQTDFGTEEVVSSLSIAIFGPSLNTTEPPDTDVALQGFSDLMASFATGMTNAYVSFTLLQSQCLLMLSCSIGFEVNPHSAAIKQFMGQFGVLCPIFASTSAGSSVLFFSGFSRLSFS